MSLKKCRECGRNVSNRAKSCPTCGIKNPARTGISARGFVIGLAVLVVVGALLGDGEETAGSDVAMDAAAAPDEIDPVETAAARDAEEAECRADIQCWGDKHSVAAGFRCEPFIEEMAKYTMEWTDGWLEPKFGYFRWEDPEDGVVTFIGDQARFQNGFGAWSNVRYECDYDPVKEAVLDVRIE